MSDKLAVYTHLKPEEYAIWVSCKEQIAALRKAKNKLTQRANQRRWNGQNIRKDYKSPIDIKREAHKAKMERDRAEYMYKKEFGLLDPPTDRLISSLVLPY